MGMTTIVSGKCRIYKTSARGRVDYLKDRGTGSWAFTCD